MCVFNYVNKLQDVDRGNYADREHSRTDCMDAPFKILQSEIIKVTSNKYNAS